MGSVFWHRAGDGKAHAYRSPRGESLCGRWGMSLDKPPKDSTPDRPKGAYCTTCKKLDQNRRRWDRPSRRP